MVRRAGRRPSSSTGGPCSTRAGVAVAPHRVAAAYLELAVLVRALEGLSAAVRWGVEPRPRLALGRACSTCARTCSAARTTTCARSPRSRPAVAVELTVVGSINLDLVARVERLPRPGETVSGGAARALSRAARARTRRSRRRGSARACAWSARSATTRSRTRRSPGLREAGVELELERVGETGVALIFVDDAGENEIVVAPGANALVTPRAGRGRGALPARDPGRGRARGGRSRRRSSR